MNAGGVTGSHDGFLVVLSVLIAAAASYTALDLASRVRAAQSRGAAAAWLTTAAICMGGGIWSMHFVAMLAYVMPGMNVSYDPWLTALSLVTAIVVTGGGFAVVSRPKSGTAELSIAGVVMGGGIVAMHYLGMAAMRMHATLAYNAFWVALSIFIAIGAAIAALWFAFRGVWSGGKLLAACMMGFAISGMHFAGMYAASFQMHEMVDEAQGYADVEQSVLALGVAATTFLILLAAIVASIFDRRFADLVEGEALKLKKSEEQFRALYRRTPLPLHALDAQGRIEEVSDAWLSLFGYIRQEVIGRPLVDFMTEDSARRTSQSDWPRLLAEGELIGTEYKFVSKDGRFLDMISASRVERDALGKFIWVIGGLTDVTASKQAEEALRQAQKMEAVGQLTGGIAHDFNNLLAVILGNLEMLKKRLPSDERLNRLTDNAIEGAKRGATLTQRMLAFARRQSLSPQPVDLPRLVAGIGDLLRQSLGPRMEIEMIFPPALATVHADPHQLEMAILNLAVNARDAMDGEGKISILGVQQKALPPGLPRRDYVCLKIVDQGPGMDESVRERAVEPFFTTKGVGKGTGLGLSMVNGFAEQSGGKMVIDSRPGQGTTVEIWLPTAQNAAVADIQQPFPPAAVDQRRLLAGQTVLAVDDDALVLMNTQALLEELGAHVLTAHSGSQALELMKQHPHVSCVVTDYAMPGMTGSQLADAVRIDHPELPIIIATGYAEVPGETVAYPKLTKPFAEDDLARAISDACMPARGAIIPLEKRR